VRASQFLILATANPVAEAIDKMRGFAGLKPSASTEELQSLSH
jgi:hypothetical protein